MKLETTVCHVCQCLAILLVFSGCASIPSEAPELSVELGNRISELENSHIILVHRFFDLKRREIDKFIEEEWVPAYARKFFDKADIAKAWDTIVTENDKAERLKFIQVLGPRIQEEINDKRQELISPIDLLERRVESKIREEYDLARSLNNSLTSFLVSASKVEENRKRYMEMIGISDEGIAHVIDEADASIDEFLSKAKTGENVAELSMSYINEIKSLINKL